MLVDVQIVNAFIDGATGGNPAGVVVDANILTAAQKLKVAQQVGLSETAFVSASGSATIKLEFFTPREREWQQAHWRAFSTISSGSKVEKYSSSRAG